MDYARICRWLGLPTGEWPPDHYILLGLQRGEQNPARLEAEAQQRLRLVRSYQLSSPELATEAMNRLAEAFACLSDPAAKRRYDAEHGITSPPATATTTNAVKAPPSLLAKSSTDTDATGLPTVLMWRAAGAPPFSQHDPVPTEKDATLSPPEIRTPLPPVQEIPATDTVAPAFGTAEVESKDPILAAAEKSWKVWKGLWSRGILLERQERAAALLHGWLQLGRYLGGVKQPLSPTQRKDFRSRLDRVDRLREELPLLLGEPGQPGYRVAILAQDEDPVRAFQEMGEDERQLLAQDWKRSTALLRSHLAFIESELDALRGEGFMGAWLRPLRSFVNNNAAWLVGSLLVLVVLACLWVWFHR